MSRRKYSTIQYQICSQLNQRKVDILKKVKQWERQEIKRCFNLFKAGASYKGVYESFEDNIDSTYKAKITRYSSALYVNYCRLKGLPIKEFQEKLRAFKSSSKHWVYANQIIDFAIKKDYFSYFQFKSTIKLPFEIEGTKALALVAKIDKDFWINNVHSMLYRKGFQLLLNKGKVTIGLIYRSKKIKAKEGTHLKAIYTSPYGGLHIASIQNLNDIDKSKLKEYYECCYGVSKESKDFSRILNKAKNIENHKDYYKNLETLKIKLKTRVNKYFEKLKSQYTEICAINVTNNSSKLYDELQKASIEQIEKNCIKYDLQFHKIDVKFEDLEKTAFKVMRKAEKETKINNQKPAGNKFRAVAGVRLFFKHLNVRIGCIRKQSFKAKEQNETFSENCSTVRMNGQAQTSDFYLAYDSWPSKSLQFV